MGDPIEATALVWGGLVAFLAVMILVDLKVGAGRAGLSIKRAAVWSGIWIALSIGFGVGLFAFAGGEAGETFFAGYVMEKALSLDNVFVFTLIFAALAVPRDKQPRLLLYGILIALVLRTIFIFLGANALENFSWIAWPFAALLAYTGYKILSHGDEDDQGDKIAERVKKRLPNASEGAVALGAIALADVLFAIDSVPAVLAITTDTFIVFSANAFALLGLRALYFLVEGLVQKFRYLQAGLGVLLIAIAAKLVYTEVTGSKVPTWLTLATIALVLAVAIGASLWASRGGGSDSGAAGPGTDPGGEGSGETVDTQGPSPERRTPPRSIDKGATAET